MFEFMDGVVDAMEETGKVVVDGVVYCLICVAKLALIITAPVWALPYTIWRKGRKQLPAYLHVEAIIKQRGGRNIEIKQENGVVNV